MYSFITIGALLGAAAITGATPIQPLEERAGCTFTTAAAAISGKKGCSTIILNNIAVPAGTTLDLTGLNAGTHVQFAGTTTFGYVQWQGPMISVSGDHITVDGAAGHVINGNGAAWWDGQGSNGGKTKPKFFAAHSMTNSVISGLNVKNTPVQAFSIDTCTNITLTGIIHDNSAGDAGGGHNTDAFDIGSSNGVYIIKPTVKNQDDCLAINSGQNIIFTGGSCSGGHGLSIGSVGGRSDNVVKNVTIENSSITNSQNGVRIKTIAGATGSVSGITYSDITMTGISNYGIVIQQDYQNGKPNGHPTTGVPITGVTLKKVTGTVKSTATDIYVLCGSGSCSKWTWSGISIQGGKPNNCTAAPSGTC